MKKDIQKNMQGIILILLFLLGIILISGMGIAFTKVLAQMNPVIENADPQVANELIGLGSYQLGSSKMIIVEGIILIGIISILIAVFLYQTMAKSATEELELGIADVNNKRRQIEAIIENMRDGIIVFDKKGRISHINPAGKRYFYITDEREKFSEIFERLNIDINLEKIMYLEEWATSEQRVCINEKQLNLYFSPLKDGNQSPNGVLMVIQDITDNLNMENMRKEFVADVSHELKTPISSIMGYADTLLETETDKETQYKFLKVIATEARRMAKLVTDLLDLSKYDNNRDTCEKVKFDLGELVKGCQEKLKFEFNKKKQKVECFVTANVPPVYADKDGIERVILNILTNSIKYTPEGGEISIFVGFYYNDAYVKVIDKGIGIPEEDLTKIFERFYRVDKSRTREMGGTGLGLSIAKELLDKNGGTIDIKSEVKKGTNVVIRIPTAKE